MKKYLYHVTDDEHAEMILKNGLIPQIGERSKLACEKEAYIYLCDKKSVPFWATILDKHVVLRVNIEKEKMDAGNVYGYFYYQEVLYTEPIVAKNICKSKVPLTLTVEQEKDLALSYIDTISLACINFATYVTYKEKEGRKQFVESQLTYVKDCVNLCKFVLPHLNFAALSTRDLANHLHEAGDGGCTLCDTYDVLESGMREGIRLYELLNEHPLATEETKWLYKWLKKTFPRKLRVNTGGWTG